MKKNLLKSIIVISLFIIITCFGYLLGELVNKKETKQVEQSQSFEATILEIKDSTILVEGVDESEKNFRNEKFLLEIKKETLFRWQKENISLINLNKEDHISVSFKGEPEEKYPALIKQVEKITLLEEKPIRRIIKINNELYYDTNKISDKPRCGLMDGTFTQSVSRNEIPNKNNTSNFGDYSYQIGEENTIEVNINKNWIIFEKK